MTSQRVCTIISFYGLREYFMEAAKALTDVGFEVNTFPLMENYNADTKTHVNELKNFLKFNKTNLVLWWCDLLCYEELQQITQNDNDVGDNKILHFVYLIDYPINTYVTHEDLSKLKLYDFIFLPVFNTENFIKNHQNIKNVPTTLFLGPIHTNFAQSFLMVDNLKFDVLILCEDFSTIYISKKLHDSLILKNISVGILTSCDIIKEGQVCEWREGLNSKLCKNSKLLIVPKQSHTLDEEYCRQPEISVLSKGDIAVAVPQPHNRTTQPQTFVDKETIFFLNNNNNNNDKEDNNISEFWANQIVEILKKFNQNDFKKIGQQAKEKISKIINWEHFSKTIEKKFIENYVEVDFYNTCVLFCESGKTDFKDFFHKNLSYCCKDNQKGKDIYKSWDEIGRQNNFLLKRCTFPANFDYQTYLEKNKNIMQLSDDKIEQYKVHENFKDIVYYYHRFVGQLNNLKPCFHVELNEFQNCSNLNNTFPPSEWKLINHVNFLNDENELLKSYFSQGCSTNFSETVEALKNIQNLLEKPNNNVFHITENLKNFLAN